MALTLGLDVGTQGAKAIAYDTQTHLIVGRGASSYGVLPSDVAGRAEQWPEVWIQVRLLESGFKCAGPDSGCARERVLAHKRLPQNECG